MSRVSSEDTKVAELTVGQLKRIVGRVVERKLEELLLDPDRGLSLRPEVREALLRSAADVQAGERVFSVEEVAEKTGLEWK
jgi:hypothetical protein